MVKRSMKKYETTLEKYTLKSSCKNNYYQKLLASMYKSGPLNATAITERTIGFKNKQANKQLT